jgi:CDP-2,3-bis-(O-geranylgeranyl)-sn-glycerol synthase
MNASQIVILVLLVVIANGAPVVISLLMGHRWNSPLDCGLRLSDQRSVLGPSKTIRGVLASVLATGLLAPLFGFSPATGAGFACLAMLGDTCSSFIKRRLGIASSHSVLLLDQLPESLLPLWFMQSTVGGTTAEILVAAAIFTLVDWLLIRLYGPGQAH